jgi:hypothetical protein
MTAIPAGMRVYLAMGPLDGWIKLSEAKSTKLGR